MGFALLGFTPAQAGAASVGDGYVIMIHSMFEPRSHRALDEAGSGSVQVDQAKTGATYASGAVGATRDDGYIVFHAIPYLARTVYPVAVRNPRLEVTQVGGDRRMLIEPNLPPDPQRVCHVETTWAGHEGPLEACSVYRVPVQHLDGMPVVTLTLHFDDAGGPRQRVHSLPAHFLLHMAIVDAPIDLTAIDRTITEPTPLVIQSIADMREVSSSPS